ncbi:MAG TPA: hypothetical protein VJY37_01690 [Anaerovoracaceae bacterium]|nr:hypothetical protein [Anaerovoracaceae bacterium]
MLHSNAVEEYLFFHLINKFIANKLLVVSVSGGMLLQGALRKVLRTEDGDGSNMPLLIQATTT